MSKKTLSKKHNYSKSSISLVDMAPSLIGVGTILYLIFVQASGLVPFLLVAATAISAALSVRLQWDSNRWTAKRRWNWLWIWATILYVIVVLLVYWTAENTLKGYKF